MAGSRDSEAVGSAANRARSAGARSHCFRAPFFAPATRRYNGSVKSFSQANGYGFIASAEIIKAYGRDTFLHKAQAGNFKVGDQVSFYIELNPNTGFPQARDVRRGHVEIKSDASKVSPKRSGRIPPPPDIERRIRPNSNLFAPPPPRHNFAPPPPRQVTVPIGLVAPMPRQQRNYDPEVKAQRAVERAQLSQMRRQQQQQQQDSETVGSGEVAN